MPVKKRSSIWLGRFRTNQNPAQPVAVRKNSSNNCQRLRLLKLSFLSRAVAMVALARRAVRPFRKADAIKQLAVQVDIFAQVCRDVQILTVVDGGLDVLEFSFSGCPWRQF